MNNEYQLLAYAVTRIVGFMTMGWMYFDDYDLLVRDGIHLLEETREDLIAG